MIFMLQSPILFWGAVTIVLNAPASKVFADFYHFYMKTSVTTNIILIEVLKVVRTTTLMSRFKFSKVSSTTNFV